MKKNFTTNIRHKSFEEKLTDLIIEYQMDTPGFTPVTEYPADYIPPSDADYELTEELQKKMYEAFLDEDYEEEERLRNLLPDLGPLPTINIEKTLALIPEAERNSLIDWAMDNDSIEETITLKCLKCDYEEEIDYEIVEETWFEGPYPTSYCPQCGKPYFVPIDIYNKKKKK